MGKHRNKHKKSKADYQPSQKSPGIPLMNSEKPDANDHATTNAKKQTAKSNTPSSWNQVVEWAKEGKTFTDWCVAVFTFVLAAAAIYQFTVMNGQLDTMRKDQRPWIDFTFASNTNALQVDSPITTMVHMVNGGKTPARSVTADIVIKMVKNGEEPKLDYPLPHPRFSTGALFPNRPMDSQVFSRVRTASDGVSAETAPVTQAEFDDFNQVNSFIIVYGIVSYRDFFGTWHWTKVCAYFPKINSTRGVTAKTCTDYADIDGN